MRQLVDERGSVAMVPALTGVLLLFVLVTLRISVLDQSQQQFGDTAETIAIAASDAASGFRTGHPCEVAKQISQLNGVNLVECRIVGFDTFIRIRIKTLGMVLFASARAGQP